MDLGRTIRRCHGWMLGALIVPIALVLAPIGTAQPLPITGRDFARVDLPAPPMALPVTLSCTRASAWTEGATNRLLLEDDVTIELGPYQFAASRAVVWLEPIEVNVAGVQREADQIALYLADAVDLRAAVAGVDAGAAHASPTAPQVQSADRLLITAVVTDSNLTLHADDMREQRPLARPSAGFIAEGESRLARYLASLTGQRPSFDRRDPARPGELLFGDAEAFEIVDDPRYTNMDLPENTGRVILPQQGSVAISAPSVAMVDAAGLGGQGNALVITGGVALEVQQADGPSSAQLLAQRAVIFLGASADAGATRFGIEEVEGVYLEGDVNIAMVRGADARTFRRASLRGSSVFYDLGADRAIVLDAVFWTFDAARGQPLYLRAQAIRQEALGQWSAKQATLANVDFAEPHFSIGADSIIVREVEQVDSGARLQVDADHVTFRAGKIPVAYLPKVRGDFKPAPLRRISFASDDGAPVIRTEWDLYGLLGIDAGDTSRADLLADAYLSRGLGIGVDANWRSSRARGGLLAYTINDQGRDSLTSGETIDRDGVTRAVLAAETIWRPDSPWTIFAEGSWISDEAFIDAFFEDLAETRRPFLTGVYATRIDRSPEAPANTAVTAELRGAINDFIVTESELQSAGYLKQTTPELGYHVIGAHFGGILSYYGQTRLGSMSLAFSENKLRDQGFKDPKRAGRAFGISPNDSIGDRLRAMGYTENTITRFDTRHEFEAPLAAGALNVVPFVVGRLTAWDTSFNEFNDNDNASQRFWGAIGLRLATTIQRISNDTASALFDLSRMRHLIEPSLTIWHAGSTIDRADLPVYDESVERLADGTAGRLGLRSTWQTMRGKVGEERSVDWLTIDAALGWSSSDVDPLSPYGNFYESRPENANLGRYGEVEGSMLLTEAVALVGGWLYDTERGTTARSSAGFRIDHGYGYGSYAEYRFLNEPSANEVAMGMRYELTRKYAAEGEVVYEIDSGHAQQLTARLTRLFPQWTLSVAASYDDIADRFGIGFSLRPVGFAGERRDRVLTLEESPEDVATGRRRALAPRFEGGPFGR
ncbi:MAG: hypothetical protein KDA20_01530 [Phycisphaerales bacterium]|nr:hypothetical protein [Phycisphaerales bacterium]